MPAFEVGKRYKTTVKNFYPSCSLVDIGQEFTCHAVDFLGCYSNDVLFEEVAANADRGWLVALHEELEDGSVVEVVE